MLTYLVSDHGLARLGRFRALLPTRAGALLTGSTDCSVRHWDAANPASSYLVCAPPELPHPSAGYSFEVRRRRARAVINGTHLSIQRSNALDRISPRIALPDLRLPAAAKQTTQ